MLTLSLAQLVNITVGQLVNDPDQVQANLQVCGASIDSRSIQHGMLFIALHGERVDGHEFVAAAQLAGACAAVVEHPVDSDLPQVLVADAAAALLDIASYWRKQFDIPVIGITGSNGKTTVKEMLASILVKAGYDALVTSGNRNNELGLPLMLLEMNQNHQLVVLEMGAGQPGDIRLLAELAQPHIGVITHIGPAHLQRLKNLQGVARTKAELFEYLATDGLAIYPLNSEQVDCLQQAAGQRQTRTFGEQPIADVSWQEHAGVMHLSSAEGGFSCRLQVPGKHNRDNAAAAAAAALALRISPAYIAEGLSHYQGYQGRLQRKAGINGAVIIDDTYNANPSSLIAALQTIVETDQQRECWLAMGDMGELGENGGQWHWHVGEQARAQGIHRLYATGELSRKAVAGFGEGAQHYVEKNVLIEALRNDIHAQVSLLVKGSRSAGMEQVVDALTVADYPTYLEETMVHHGRTS